MENIEEIQANIEKYISLLKRCNDDSINVMAVDLSTRLATSPAAAKKDDAGCSDGGLIKNILQNLNILKKIDSITWNQCNPKSLYKAALLCDLGIIGSTSEEMFLPQDSDWHKEKLGLLYKKNPELLEFHPIQLTFQILTKYGISLEEEEYYAILSVKWNRPINHLGKLLLASRILSK